MLMPKARPKLKICGNHLPTDLTLIEKYIEHIDYLGFIFTPISKRYVTPSTVRLWLQEFPYLRDKAVAVFLDQELAEVKDILQQTGIYHVQLHGGESSAYCGQLKKDCAIIGGERVQVWKVIPVENGQVAPFEQYLHVVDTILLDTKVKDTVGGTGQPFAWSVILEVQRVLAKHALPLLVAGGINPDNVTDLIGAYGIDGVDLASGVEVNLAKNEQKLVKLIKGVKQNGGEKVQLP